MTFALTLLWPDEHLEGDVQALEAQCLKIGSMRRTPLYNARWLLVIFPLFVADISGDSVGSRECAVGSDSHDAAAACDVICTDQADS